VSKRRKSGALRSPAAGCWRGTAAAAVHLGLAASTLEKLRGNGLGPRYSKAGRRCIYHVADLDDWMKARAITSTSQQGLPMTGTGTRAYPKVAAVAATTAVKARPRRTRAAVARREVGDELE
jgi:hypothetical protein